MAPVFERAWEGFEVPAPDMFPKPKRRRMAPPRQLVEEVEPISVLFVDSFNRVRSVLAQAQAELVRMWTLNQRGYNLFSCLDSAGLRISSPLTERSRQTLTSGGASPNRAALDALLGEHDLPREKEDIRHRILHKQTSRGITFEDFDNFDYILTFDRASLTELRDLHWIAHGRACRHGRAGVKARTRLISDYNPRHGSRDILLPAFNGAFTPSRLDLESTILGIETELYNFLMAKAAWIPPSRVSSNALTNRYRSRQFLARNTRVTQAKIETLKLLYGRISVDKEVEGRYTRVVTVTARDGQKLRDALDNARLVLG